MSVLTATKPTDSAVSTIPEETSDKEAQKGHNAVVVYPHAQASKMSAAFAQSTSTTVPREGELVSGEVLDISKNGIVVNIEGQLTGLVRGRELDDESGEYSKLSIGDKVEATVLSPENEQGMLELSFRQAGHRKAWESLSELQEAGEVVEAKIIDANKGGLMVKVGNVEGFLPVSQLTIEHYPRVEGGDKNRILERLRTYINQLFKVKIITVKEKEEKLIVSEKAAKEREQHEMLAKYQLGDEVTGRVTGVVDFGAFVEFGDGLEGLVHISELAWQRIDDPTDIVKVGNQLKAKIIALDDGRVSLSVKKLKEDPWKLASEKYKVGQEVEGKVLKINPYGAFVELDPDIHGLAHVSELTRDGADPHKLLTIGETGKFKILSLEPAAHRLGLGLL
jgi:small subunit ribosomal protein S1